MNKNILRILTGAGVMSLMMATPSYAIVKYLEINADTDSLPEHTAGESFVPYFEVDDDDEDLLTLNYDNVQGLDRDNPTVPVTVRFKIHADEEILDDDLEITGKGFRASYIDSVSVDNDEATGRLEVYPFFQLTTPAPTINYSTKTVSWPEVSYAGRYELVIGYTTRGGEAKTAHEYVNGTSANVGSYIQRDADGRIGVAVRALATKDEGYMTANVSNAGIASWESLSFADTYQVKISWVDNSGTKRSHKEKVTGTTLDVRSYRNSAASNFSVEVRAVPKQNEAKYYNIAASEFGVTGEESVDTSDYDVDDVWEFMGDYTGMVDGNFAQHTYTQASVTGTPTGSGTDGVWKRTSYRWQFFKNGVPCSNGWQQIKGTWYYFDADSYMHTGWLQDAGKWYYLETKVGSSNGAMLTGSHMIHGKTYQFDASGACQNP